MKNASLRLLLKIFKRPHLISYYLLTKIQGHLSSLLPFNPLAPILYPSPDSFYPYLMNSPTLSVSMKPSVIENHNLHCFSFLWIFKANGMLVLGRGLAGKSPDLRCLPITFTIADFKLPMWHHWLGWNWEEMYTKSLGNGSRTPLQSKTLYCHI